MGAEGWVTVAVIAALVVVLAREIVQPAAAMLMATMVLLFLGVVNTQQAFSGFSNEAPIVVAALLVFARGVDISGVFQPVIRRLFGAATGRPLIARLIFPIAGLSGFLNNTTLVAMSVPGVLDLCQRRGLPASQFLIPVSYAAVLGGAMTTIGTSTNLTVSGLLIASGREPLGLFELTPIGLPIMLIGCLAITLLAQRLLPDRSKSNQERESGREYAVSMRVIHRGPAQNRTVEEAGLRHLHGVFLVQIERQGRYIAPVRPDEVLMSSDVLTFVGRVDQIVDLQRMPGLVSTERRQIAQLEDGTHAFYEAVVGGSLNLAGRKLRDTGFRGRYGGAVVAIHRSGQRLNAKLGEVTLRMGDTLLVLADGGFAERLRDSSDFLLIAARSGISPTQPRHGGIVALVGIGFVTLVGTGLVPILQGALAAALLLVVTGVLTLRQARDAIDLNIVVLIAAAFGLGAAVSSSGLGAQTAQVLVSLLGPFGPVGTLAAILVATMALTELVSNNAAAALMFPIALSTADALGVDARPFVITLTLGASLSFLTPIGYQTNLMVYAIGGYRFRDFTLLGLPLNITALVLIVSLVPIVFPF